MSIIKHSQDVLILRFSVSIWVILLFGAAFTLGGLFFGLLGLAAQQSQDSQHNPILWALPLGLGILLLAGGWRLVIPLFQVRTFTFDKSRDRVLVERYGSLNRLTEQLIEFPLHLIQGVEISESDSIDSDLRLIKYDVRLIVAPIFWRITLTFGNHKYEDAVIIAKLISQFAGVAYFPDSSAAPRPAWQQKILDQIQPGWDGWRWVEKEIERLREHLIQHPQDAQAHQDLGFSLYYFGKIKAAQSCFQQAEILFDAQQKTECAAVARVLQLS